MVGVGDVGSLCSCHLARNSALLLQSSLILLKRLLPALGHPNALVVLWQSVLGNHTVSLARKRQENVALTVPQNCEVQWGHSPTIRSTGLEQPSSCWQRFLAGIVRGEAN